ncbi:hypothetical protein B0H16DRAFT_1743439 [Mycena metata]|uniref:Peptidase S1 domain-containing protein n=1 Tax=Mycena metata TaxID=1033252 RepID=A0AAD7H6K7_9AGAR|nr:hypothetical protein B0H16DRAFT_1743439 [Mycena metata]
MLTLVLSALLPFVLFIHSALSVPIGGGIMMERATKGELPWRVQVFVYTPASGSGGLCAGAVISPNWVMTAPHCPTSFEPGNRVDVYVGAAPENLTVVAGASDGPGPTVAGLMANAAAGNPDGNCTGTVTTPPYIHLDVSAATTTAPPVNAN